MRLLTGSINTIGDIKSSSQFRLSIPTVRVNPRTKEAFVFSLAAVLCHIIYSLVTLPIDSTPIHPDEGYSTSVAYFLDSGGRLYTSVWHDQFPSYVHLVRLISHFGLDYHTSSRFLTIITFSFFLGSTSFVVYVIFGFGSAVIATLCVYVYPSITTFSVAGIQEPVATYCMASAVNMLVLLSINRPKSKIEYCDQILHLLSLFFAFFSGLIKPTAIIPAFGMLLTYRCILVGEICFNKVFCNYVIVNALFKVTAAYGLACVISLLSIGDVGRSQMIEAHFRQGGSQLAGMEIQSKVIFPNALLPFILVAVVGFVMSKKISGLYSFLASLSSVALIHSLNSHLWDYYLINYLPTLALAMVVAFNEFPLKNFGFLIANVTKRFRCYALAALSTLLLVFGKGWLDIQFRRRIQRIENDAQLNIIKKFIVLKSPTLLAQPFYYHLLQVLPPAELQNVTWKRCQSQDLSPSRVATLCRDGGVEYVFLFDAPGFPWSELAKSLEGDYRIVWSANRVWFLQRGLGIK